MALENYPSPGEGKGTGKERKKMKDHFPKQILDKHSVSGSLPPGSTLEKRM